METGRVEGRGDGHLGEKRADAELRNLASGGRGLAERHRVQHHELREHRGGDAAGRGAGEDTVRGEGKDPPRAVLLEDLGRLAERAGCVHHVVDDDGVAAVDAADQVHALNLAGFGALKLESEGGAGGREGP